MILNKSKNNNKNKKIRKSNILDIHIVKRKGNFEIFNSKKIYSTCLSSHMKDSEARKLSKLIMKNSIKWIEKKKQVNSNQIFNFVKNEIKKLNKDASFMYETHRDIY